MTNSIHDMGGMHGFGAVTQAPNEPIFHEEWEARICGMLLASLGLFGVSLDNVRSRMELIPPGAYLKTPYYAKWVMALENLVTEKGIATQSELEALARGEEIALEKDMQPIPTDGLLAFISTGATAARQIESKPLFALGDTVRARNLNSMGHTRLPRYVRGKLGTIIADCGGQIYPEVSARLEGDGPERLYSIKFSARELWVLGANINDTVCVDLWEPYLESCPAETEVHD